MSEFAHWVHCARLSYDPDQERYSKSTLEPPASDHEFGALTLDHMHNHLAAVRCLFPLEYRRIAMRKCQVRYTPERNPDGSRCFQALTEDCWFAHFRGILFLRTASGREEFSHCKRTAFTGKKTGKELVEYYVYPTGYEIL